MSPAFLYLFLILDLFSPSSAIAERLISSEVSSMRPLLHGEPGDPSRINLTDWEQVQTFDPQSNNTFRVRPCAQGHNQFSLRTFCWYGSNSTSKWQPANFFRSAYFDLEAASNSSRLFYRAPTPARVQQDFWTSRSWKPALKWFDGRKISFFLDPFSSGCLGVYTDRADYSVTLRIAAVDPVRLFVLFLGFALVFFSKNHRCFRFYEPLAGFLSAFLLPMRFGNPSFSAQFPSVTLAVHVFGWLIGLVAAHTAWKSGFWTAGCFWMAFTMAIAFFPWFAGRTLRTAWRSQGETAKPLRSAISKIIWRIAQLMGLGLVHASCAVGGASAVLTAMVVVLAIFCENAGLLRPSPVPVQESRKFVSSDKFHDPSATAKHLEELRRFLADQQRGAQWIPKLKEPAAVLKFIMDGRHVDDLLRPREQSLLMECEQTDDSDGESGNP